MDQDVKTVIQYPVGATEFDIPFDYLSRKFVRVSLVSDDNRRLLSNITEYRYVSKTRVKLLVETTGFDRVEIRRFTSASERVVDFSDGSVLRASDLNVSQIQSAHIAEEARDSALMAMPQDDAGNLDARNRRIVRLAPGVDGTDAINKDQLDTTLGEAGGILSEIIEVKGDFYEYLEKFAEDTSMVRGVVWVYNSGSAVGGETVVKVEKPTTVYSVPYLEINGSRQEIGYHYDFDPATQELTLAKPLVAGDFLMAMTTESYLPIESLLASPVGAEAIGTKSGKTIQRILDESPRYFTPEMFGAKGDGLTNDTKALQDAVDAAMSSGGGKVILKGNTTYLFDHLLVAREKSPQSRFEARLIIEGSGGSVLKHTGSLTEAAHAFWVRGVLGTGSLADIYMRDVVLRDFSINGTVTSTANGLVLQRATAVRIENVYVNDFGGNGYRALDLYDSTIDSLEVQRCGIVPGATVGSYGMYITGAYDQSNANHYIACRVEMCPLIIAIDKGCRHNYFHNCKFEQGRVNPTTSNPVYINDATELAFEACQFVQNYDSAIRFLVVTDALFPYWVTHGTEKVVNFTDCSFVCSRSVTAYWIDVAYTTFTACAFSSCNGGTQFPLSLGKNSFLTDAKVVIRTAEGNVLELKGAHSRVTNLKVTYFQQPTSGVFIKFTGLPGLADVVVDGFTFENFEPFAPYSGHTDFMGDVVVMRRAGYVYNGTNDRVIYGCSTLSYSGASPATWNNLRNGYNGQVVIVHAKSNPVTLDVSGGLIITKTGSNVTIPTNGVSALVNISGVWRQLY